MVDVRSVIESWFITLRKDIYVLIRIESLVSFVTVAFLAMFVMDIYRARSRSSATMSVLDKVDRISDRVVLYLLGTMQAAPFDNELFPVWSIVLVSLHASIGYLSRYGIPDKVQRITEMGNVIKFLGVAFLTSTRGSEFMRPLWSIWAILLLRSIYRFGAQSRALRSLWHGRSSELLPEYMRDDHDRSLFKGIVRDASTMEGYRYLVHGESNQKIKLLRPRYVLYLHVVDHSSLVTLDKIWESSNGVHGDDSKDLSLAFSLSRFLRCRLEDVRVDAGIFSMSRDLIMARILHVDLNSARAFRIMELEIAFLRDYFYTLYPIVFCQGLASLFFSILQSLATIGVAFWLAVDINKVYEPLEGEVVNVVHGYNVDVIITWVFMFFMMFKEIWEMVTYSLSDWTKLLVACEYARLRGWWIRNATTEKLLSCFLSRKISDPWHGCIGQYEFLQVFDYRPSFWNLMYRATLGLVEQRMEGRKPGTNIKVPECVKPAILKALRSMNLDGLGSRHLPRDIPTLSAAGMLEQFKWVLLDLYTCSQVILVWHIATSMCEIKLARDRGIDLSNPGFLRSTLTYLKTLLCSCCCPPQPYLLAENVLNGQLRTSYTVANNLSRYCAYMLVSQSDLLPDSLAVPEVIYNMTVSDACEIMDGCDSLASKYDKLNEMLPPEAAEEIRLTGSIVEKGALLGMQLIAIGREEMRWEILAGVWADLLVHIAPSWNAEAHKSCLEYGGEFVTFIWGLLWHCGIEKSSLWREEDDDANEDAYEQPQPAAAAPRGSGGHDVVVEDDVTMNSADQNGVEDHEEESVPGNDGENQQAEQVLRRQAAEADVVTANEAHHQEESDQSAGSSTLDQEANVTD